MFELHHFQRDLVAVPEKIFYLPVLLISLATEWLQYIAGTCKWRNLSPAQEVQARGLAVMTLKQHRHCNPQENHKLVDTK